MSNSHSPLSLISRMISCFSSNVSIQQPDASIEPPLLNTTVCQLGHGKRKSSQFISELEGSLISGITAWGGSDMQALVLSLATNSPNCLTLFASDGSVVFQNTASYTYYGDLSVYAIDKQFHNNGFLAHLEARRVFQFEPEVMSEMLAVITRGMFRLADEYRLCPCAQVPTQLAGGEFKRTIKVPSSIINKPTSIIDQSGEGHSGTLESPQVPIINNICDLGAISSPDPSTRKGSITRTQAMLASAIKTHNDINDRSMHGIGRTATSSNSMPGQADHENHNNDSGSRGISCPLESNQFFPTQLTALQERSASHGYISITSGLSDHTSGQSLLQQQVLSDSGTANVHGTSREGIASGINPNQHPLPIHKPRTRSESQLRISVLQKAKSMRVKEETEGSDLGSHLGRRTSSSGLLQDSKACLQGDGHDVNNLGPLSLKQSSLISTLQLLSSQQTSPPPDPVMTGFAEEIRSATSPSACSWHEVTARLLPSPGKKGHIMMLAQTDVTAHAKLTQTLAQMSEVQLSIISNIFPRHVVDFLSMVDINSLPSQIAHLANRHEEVTLLFMDIVGFTSMCKEVDACEVLSFLNDLFTAFDQLVTKNGVQKVETAGDCYIVAGGILSNDADGFSSVAAELSPSENAKKVMAFAKDMLRCSKNIMMPHNGLPVRIRIGLHTGSCVSGIVGTKIPKFSIFGDSMNTASRMESTCIPGRIQISAVTRRLLGDTETWQPTGGVEVKGKGLMETYLWVPPPRTLSLPAIHEPGTPRDSISASISWQNNVGSMGTSGVESQDQKSPQKSPPSIDPSWVRMCRMSTELRGGAYM